MLYCGMPASFSGGNIRGDNARISSSAYLAAVVSSSFPVSDVASLVWLNLSNQPSPNFFFFLTYAKEEKKKKEKYTLIKVNADGNLKLWCIFFPCFSVSAW